MSEILGHDVNGRPLRAGDRVMVAECAAHGHGRIGRLIGPCPDFAGQLEAQMEHGPWALPVQSTGAASTTAPTTSPANTRSIL